MGELQHWHHSITYAVTSDSRLAALEVVNAPAAAFGSYNERLRILIQGVNRVGHVGAPAMFDAGTLSDGRPYVIKELLDGVTLRARVGDGKLTTELAIAILRDICAVLAAAHAAGVVHGGLELGHVLLINRELDPSLPRLKLIDWGISEAIEEEVRRNSNLTLTCRPRRPTPADDVYAVGVMMHQLLEPIPPALEPLWIAMLADDPRKRPTIAAVVRQLAQLPMLAVTKASPVALMKAQPIAVTQPYPIATAEIAVPKPLPVAVTQPYPAPKQSRVVAPPPEPRVDPPKLVVIDSTSSDSFVALPKRGSRLPLVALLAVACAAPILALWLATDRRASQPGVRAHRVAARHVNPAPRLAPAKPVVVQVKPVVVQVKPVVAPEPVVTQAKPVVAAHAPVVAARAPLVAAPMPVTAPKPVVAAATAPTVPTPAIARTPKSDDSVRAALIAQYQRVGHNLITLQHKLGPESVSAVSSRFQWIKIEAAVATPTSRRLVAATLRGLQSQIDDKLAQACAPPEACR